jgi:hypothetical protein
MHPTSKSREFLGPMSGKASLPVGWLMAPPGAARIVRRPIPAEYERKLWQISLPRVCAGYHTNGARNARSSVIEHP